MRTVLLIVSLVAAPLLAGAAVAADDSSGRYTMTPTKDGAIRLDTETGEVALCRQKDDKLTCEPIADSGAAPLTSDEHTRAENQRLRDELRQLEERLGALEQRRGLPGPGAAPEIQLPSEADVDKAFDYVERMMRKIKERMKKLEEQHPEETPL